MLVQHLGLKILIFQAFFIETIEVVCMKLKSGYSSGYKYMQTSLFLIKINLLFTKFLFNV